MAEPQEHGFDRLKAAIAALLESPDKPAKVLWTLQCEQRIPAARDVKSANGAITLPHLSSALFLEDAVLENVRDAWKVITGGDDAAFMKFDVREGLGDDVDG